MSLKKVKKQLQIKKYQTTRPSAPTPAYQVPYCGTFQRLSKNEVVGYGSIHL
jgi:hypothetical protein